jgi:hypothetical protein
MSLCIKHYLAARPSGAVYNFARMGRYGRVEPCSIEGFDQVRAAPAVTLAAAARTGTRVAYIFGHGNHCITVVFK